MSLNKFLNLPDLFFFFDNVIMRNYFRAVLSQTLCFFFFPVSYPILLVGWHHQLNGHELGQTLGDGEEKGGPEYCSSCGHKKSAVTW